jgi:RecA/RadA recombinase
MEKLRKNSQIKMTAPLEDSVIFTDQDTIVTGVPMINVALSGDLNGGMHSGLTVLAGPSKHFKSSFALLIAAAYQAKHPDGVVLFYDSEFGSPIQYFKTFGVDTSRVVHTPIMDIEELKFDLISQLEEIQRNDKVLILIDSIGNLASKKEVEDAKEKKSVADMSRAKSLKSLFRMVTPYLKTKNLSMIAINHTYKTMEMFSKDVVSGGTGIYYSADNIWIVGRQQNKKDTDLLGYHFVINVDKSRFVKEKSKIPITVSFEGGIEKFSGLLEIALAGGFVTKPSMGWYARKGKDEKFREKDTFTAEFWDPILKSKDFSEFIKAQYVVGHRSMVEGFLEDVVTDASTKEEGDDE